jgi:hypothetical protein
VDRPSGPLGNGYILVTAGTGRLVTLGDGAIKKRRRASYLDVKNNGY